MDTTATKESQDKIRRWLEEEGFALEAIQRKGYRWIYAASSKGGEIAVSQDQKSEDRIDIYATMGLPEEYMLLPPEVREMTIVNIGVTFAMMNLQYDGLGRNQRKTTIISAIFYDGLTKNAFMREVMRVTQGMKLMEYAIRRAVASHGTAPS